MRDPRPYLHRAFRAVGPAWPALAAALAVLLMAACGGSQPRLVPQPAVPTGPQLRTWPLSGEIHLNWDPTPGAARYTLSWSDEPDVAASPDERVEGITGTTYIHKGLEDGEPYYYYLEALDPAGKVLHAYRPIGDIPYRYTVRRFRNFLAVVPRPNDSYETLAEQYLQDKHKGWLIRDFNDLSALRPFQAVLIPQKPYEPGGLSDKGYRTVPILTYHQLTRTRPSKMAVLQSDFELQMAYLKRNRFQVITLQQFVDFLTFQGQVPERAVVITFDDGWRSTYTIALPVLRKHGFPATLFLTTDLVGSGRKALTWPQVKELEASGVIDVQCHTRSHANLADSKGRSMAAYLDFLTAELSDSRALIQRRIGKSCDYLAYPYGATNHLVAAMAQRAGYKAAFTVERGPNPFFVSDFRVLRSMVYGGTNLKEFAANLETFSDRVLK